MTRKKAPEVRKNEIFNAALDCFNARGYFNTSIEDIAHTAGISKGGIYHYFSSKKELFIELFHTCVDRYFEHLRKTVHVNGDAARDLCELVRRSEEVFQKNQDILKFCLEFMTLGTRDETIRTAVSEFYKNRVSIFARMLSDGMTKGIYKDIPLVDTARTLYFLSMGFFLTYFTIRVDFDPMQQHTVNMATILEGIRKKQSAP